MALNDSTTALLPTDALTEFAAASWASKVFTSSDAFFACAPTPYIQHYMFVTRKNQRLYDGYVPEVHNGQVFSYKLVQALCNGFARKVVGKNISFASISAPRSDETVKKVSKWFSDHDGRNVVKKAISFELGLENSLIMLNFDLLDGFWPEAVREDYYVFSEDSKGELTDLKVLTKGFLSGTGESAKEYMLIQHRYFKDERKPEVHRIGGKRMLFSVGDRKPYVVYEVVLAQPQINSSRQPIQSYNPIPWDSLPESVRRQINKQFGAVKVGEELPLPFKGTLGAWQLKHNGFNSVSPNLPFGQALTQDIWAEALEYDIYCSYRNIDINNGKGQIIMNRSVSMFNLKKALGGGNVTTVGQMGELYAAHASEIESDDPEEDRPIINQFSLRAEEWNALINDCLKRIAVKMHTSPKIISSFLGVSDAQKTATEIESDDDSVIDWIDEERNEVSRQLNKMIECLCDANGWVGNVGIKFGSAGVKPLSTLIDEVAKLMDYGLITKRDAVKRLFPDKDEPELDEYLKQCEEEREAKCDLLLTPDGEAR